MMGTILLETFINAPLERVFDLSRHVDLHIESAAATNEKAIAGVTAGMMNLNDIVTWEATHFGIRQKLQVQIVAMNRPHSFRDSQIKGPFAGFNHDHFFETENTGTLMKDVFSFECPLGLLGRLVDPIITRHLRLFLIQRNQVIKSIAESSHDWKKFLK